MMKKLSKSKRTICGMLATIMIAMCLTAIVPAPKVLANGKKDATTTENSSAESSNNNDLGDVNVQMSADGKRLDVTGLSTGNGKDTWNTIFNKTKVFIIGFSGLTMLIMVGLFIKNFVALGAAANNPTARSQALTGCLWTGIAAALAGSVTLIVGLFWNAFK